MMVQLPQKQSDTETRVPASELNMTSQSGIKVASVAGAEMTPEVDEVMRAKNKETSDYVKALLDRPDIQLVSNLAVEPQTMDFRVVVLIADGSVSLKEASFGIDSGSIVEENPLILRIMIGGRNTIFVCGPKTRDIQEAALRAHALTKDNGPTISRLFNAE